MLAGPEQALLLTEFEAQYSPEAREQYSHHEEGLSVQRNFKQQVLALVEPLKTWAILFLKIPFSNECFYSLDGLDLVYWTGLKIYP